MKVNKIDSYELFPIKWAKTRFFGPKMPKKAFFLQKQTFVIFYIWFDIFDSSYKVGNEQLKIESMITLDLEPPYRAGN